MNKTTRGALLLIAGLILVAAASVLYLLNEQQDEMAGQTAVILLEQLQLNEPVREAGNPVPSAPPSDAAHPSVPAAPTEELTPANPEDVPEQPSAMPVKLVAGYESVGVLRIPALGIELPILDNWDYDRLKLAPCRYTGSAAGGDLILMGHNYRSHFKALYQVEPGTKVTFTDVNGVCYSYTVDRIDTIKGTETEKLPADYALSLFTCTPGGQSRLVVRCRTLSP